MTDAGNGTIRKVTQSGTVSTVAGVAGSHGVKAGTLPASLNQPTGIAFGRDGGLLVSDAVEAVIVEITLP